MLMSQIALITERSEKQDDIFMTENANSDHEEEDIDEEI